MEETCRAKGCICVWRFHSLVSTAPSESYSPPIKLSEPKYLCTVEVSRNRLLDWSIGVGHWSESQCPSLFPEMQKLWTFILLIECWVFSFECLVLLQCVVIELYSRNHHLTYETEYISRVSGGLLQWNRKRLKHGKDNNSQKTTRERAWRLLLYCISLAPTGYPTGTVFLAFQAAVLLCGSISLDYSQ